VLKVGLVLGVGTPDGESVIGAADTGTNGAGELAVGILLGVVVTGNSPVGTSNGVSVDGAVEAGGNEAGDLDMGLLLGKKIAGLSDNGELVDGDKIVGVGEVGELDIGNPDGMRENNVGGSVGRLRVAGAPATIEGNTDSIIKGVSVATGRTVGESVVGTSPVGVIANGESVTGVKVNGTNAGVIVTGRLEGCGAVTDGLDSCGAEKGDEVNGVSNTGGIEESGTFVSAVPGLEGDKVKGDDPNGTFVPGRFTGAMEGGGILPSLGFNEPISTGEVTLGALIPSS
jgi:hypothetical protein